MRILMVEDEASLADSVRRGLRAEGFEVDWEADGADGLWRATEGSYDAIILDIMLPSKNGYEVCREIRRANVWTPVLMLTAKNGEYDEVEAFELGANDYLRKPFSHPVLVARVRALARGSYRAAAPSLTLGPLVLDPTTLRLARQPTDTGSTDETLNDSRDHCDAIELTPREFAVLEALAHRSPRIVSKRELLDAVWGMDFEGDPNIVEVYVGYVRKKAAALTERKIVKTVRGAGYQLVTDHPRRAVDIPSTASGSGQTMTPSAGGATT